jgi:hypothetical protein
VSPRHHLHRSPGRRPSPRERGCLHGHRVGGVPVIPFPARAGVSPPARSRTSTPTPLPRASGGVSPATTSGRSAPTPSPRQRGCLRLVYRSARADHPFPARAGVSPSSLAPSSGPSALPRASGGVSSAPVTMRVAPSPSPRERGCLRRIRYWPEAQHPFPARAGVSHESSAFLVGSTTPSPRERGCLQVEHGLRGQSRPFPARAGVSPLSMTTPFGPTVMRQGVNPSPSLTAQPDAAVGSALWCATDPVCAEDATDPDSRHHPGRVHPLPCESRRRRPKRASAASTAARSMVSKTSATSPLVTSPAPTVTAGIKSSRRSPDAMSSSDSRC